MTTGLLISKALALIQGQKTKKNEVIATSNNPQKPTPCHWNDVNFCGDYFKEFLPDKIWQFWQVSLSKPEKHTLMSHKHFRKEQKTPWTKQKTTFHKMAISHSSLSYLHLEKLKNSSPNPCFENIYPYSFFSCSKATKKKCEENIK